MAHVIMTLMLLVAIILGGAFPASANGGGGTTVPGDVPGCDRVTGGGHIIGQSGHKADFGLAAGCQKDHWDDDDDDDRRRHGRDERSAPRFGHLEFQDKRAGFKLRSNVTAYFFVESSLDPTAITVSSSSSSSRSSEPRGTRMLCGTARTNDGDVDWAVQVSDNGEPGRSKDDFIIEVRKKDGTPVYGPVYGKLQGGNIQLHKPPRQSSPDGFGGDCSQFL